MEASNLIDTSLIASTITSVAFVYICQRLQIINDSIIQYNTCAVVVIGLQEIANSTRAVITTRSVSAVVFTQISVTLTLIDF